MKKERDREGEDVQHVQSLEIHLVTIRRPSDRSHALDNENEFTRAAEVTWNVIIGSRRDYKEITSD